MAKPVTTYVTQKRISWHGHVMRREDTTLQSNNKGEETSRKAQTEVGEQSAEQFLTTQARSKARAEPRSMEKGSHDRPGDPDSDKNGKGEKIGILSICIHTMPKTRREKYV